MRAVRPAERAGWRRPRTPSAVVGASIANGSFADSTIRISTMRRVILATACSALFLTSGARVSLGAAAPGTNPAPAPAPAPIAAAAAGAAAGGGAAEKGFVALFDGKTLDGWTMLDKKGEGYGVKDGVIFCAKGGGGKLLTDKEYSDFVLRFEFKMPPEGSNNGIGIRAPLEGDAAYMGMEIQVLDEQAALSGKWGKLREAQYHGSVYDVFAAKRGAMKPAGTWNQEEITAKGRQITVKLNGTVILDVNLDDAKDPEVLQKHPGLKNTTGHIGFLGHNDYVEFRNIRIKAL
jgi:hypothetical protein